jgi:hypothetical protein
MIVFGLIEMGFPLTKCVDTTFKTDSTYPITRSYCGLNHEVTNTVIGDQMHDYFLAYHVWGFATQNIHAHRRFYILSNNPTYPALKVKFGQVIPAILIMEQPRKLLNKTLRALYNRLETHRLGNDIGPTLSTA